MYQRYVLPLAFVTLVVTAAPLLAEAPSGTTGGQMLVSSTSMTESSGCSAPLPQDEGSGQVTLAFIDIIAGLSPEPNEAGYFENGCWYCHQLSSCCSCDPQFAIIPCDDYCGCS